MRRYALSVSSRALIFGEQPAPTHSARVGSQYSKNSRVVRLTALLDFPSVGVLPRLHRRFKTLDHGGPVDRTDVQSFALKIFMAFSADVVVNQKLAFAYSISLQIASVD